MDDMVLYICKLKDPMNPEAIKTENTVHQNFKYRTNTQKSVTFLYNNSDPGEKEIIKNSLIIPTKNKSFGIYFAKDEKEFTMKFTKY